MPRFARWRAVRRNEYWLLNVWSTAHVASTLPSSMTTTSYEYGDFANASAASSMNSGRFSASSFAGTSTDTSTRGAGDGRRTSTAESAGGGATVRAPGEEVILACAFEPTARRAGRGTSRPYDGR